MGLIGLLFFIILLFVIALIFALIIFLIVLLIRLGIGNGEGFQSFGEIETPKKRAGRKGEEYAADLIRQVLNEKDTLLNNVKISVDDNETEIDNIIINNRGIFIIEVKNYRGVLYGNEDDYEWTKVKESSGGNLYQNTVKNPIKQTKRQVYILAQFLKQYGYKVWVEGYVLMVKENSPVDHEMILKSIDDIDDVIHQGTNNKITNSTREEIIKLLL